MMTLLQLFLTTLLLTDRTHGFGANLPSSLKKGQLNADAMMAEVVDDLTTTITALNGEISRLEEQASKQGKQPPTGTWKSWYTDEKKKNKIQQVQFRAERQSMDLHLQQVQEELEITATELDTVYQQLDDVTQQLEIASTERHGMEVQVQQMQEQVDTAAVACSGMQTHVEEMLQHIETTTREHTGMEFQIQELKDQLQATTNALQAKEEELHDFTENKSGLQEALDELKQQHAKELAEIQSQLDQSVSMRQTELNRAARRSEKIHADYKEKLDAIQKLRQQELRLTNAKWKAKNEALEVAWGKSQTIMKRSKQVLEARNDRVLLLEQERRSLRVLTRLGLELIQTRTGNKVSFVRRKLSNMMGRSSSSSSGGVSGSAQQQQGQFVAKKSVPVVPKAAVVHNKDSSFLMSLQRK